MTNFSENSNNDFRVTNKSNPCQVCGDKTSKCRTHVRGEIYLCATYGAASKFDRVDEFECRKTGDRWATFKLYQGDQSPTDKQEMLARLTKIRQESQKREEARRERALSVELIDKAIRSLSNWFDLDDDHRADLVKRGLTTEQIKQGLYFTVTPKATTPAELPPNVPGIKNGRIVVTGRGYACIAFNGDGLAIGYQIRLDNRDKSKYRWATGEISSHLKNGELPLSYHPLQAGTELYLMEGLNKSFIAHHRLGIATLGASSGHFAASGEQFKQIIELIPSQTKLVIVPDAGAIANPDVLRAIQQTADLIAELGREVLYLWWNQNTKDDPDIDELDGLDSATLVEFLPKLRDTTLFQNSVEATHPEHNFKKIVESKGLSLSNCATNRTFDAWICEEVLKDRFVVLAGEFYEWQEVEGYWKKQEAAKVKHMIARASDRAYRLEYTKTFGWQALPRHKKESKAFNFARDYFASFKQVESRHLRTFRNGTLNLVTKELLPKRKEDLVTSFIDCDFVPDQPCPQVFVDFITSSFGDQAIATIRAVTAMFLDPTSPWDRFPYLIGASGGGKSTLGQVWGNLFEQGYGAGDFSTFERPESRHYLSGLSLYGVPDVKGRLSGTAMTSFYKIVSNEPLDARPLYQGAYTQQFYVRTWVASVNPLSIEEQDDGWKRRALVIPVIASSRKPDPYLGQKLRDAMGEIISWAIAMPKEERDPLIMEETKNELALEIQHLSTLMGDSVKAFIDACLRPTSETKTMDGYELHQAYLAFCRENIDRNSTMGYQKFISRLKSNIPNNYVARQSKRIEGDLVNIPSYWQNLEFNPSQFSIDNTGVNAAYTCVRKHCGDGGLEAIAAFWTSPEPTEPTALVIADILAPIADMIADIEDGNADIVHATEIEEIIADMADTTNTTNTDPGNQDPTVDPILSNYLDYLISVKEKSDLEAFFGLANFRARFPDAISFLRAATDHGERQGLALTTVQSLREMADRLEGWGNEIESQLPQLTRSQPLSVAQRLEKVKIKKENKKNGKH